MSAHMPGPCQCYVRDGAHIQCQLCAAAPALLKALEAAEKALSRLPHSWGAEFAELPVIRAAIRAAKGKSNESV